MNENTGGDRFEMRLHLKDGSVESFLHSDLDQAEHQLVQLQPAKLFSERITIATHESIITYLGSQVEKVDFVRPGFGGWTYAEHILHVTEIEEREFHQQTRMLGVDSFPQIVGDMFISFLSMKMVSGRHFYAVVEGAVAQPLDRAMRLHQILSGPTMHFRLPGGRGNAVLNLDNLVSFTITPNPADVPTNAWRAERIGEPVR